jgi:transcriptional regulator with XRE-family HTH domain
MLTLAELIENLFEEHRRPDGRLYTNEEICLWIRENVSGAHLSPGYLAKLRSGQASNPSRDTLIALCLAFKVSADYFFPELRSLSQHNTSPEQQMRLALREQGLDEEAERSFMDLFKIWKRRKQ